MPASQLPTADSRPARTRGDLALRVMGIVVAVLTNATETDGWMSLALGLNRASLPGVVLIGASQLGAVVALLRRGPRATPWILLGLQLAGMLQVASVLHGTGMIGEWTPGYWALPICALALVRLPRHQYVAHLVGAPLLLQLVLLFCGWRIDRMSMADSIFVVEPIALVLFFGDALMEQAKGLDAAQARRRTAQELRSRQEAVEQARRESARMLHDHVLHALHALSRSTASRQMLVDECRVAHDAMVQRPSVGDQVRVEQLLRDDPVLDLAGARVAGHSEPVPRAVAMALAAAAHEALSNVVRHAHARQVSVGVAAEDGGVLVSVHDDGCGFDATREPGRHLGRGASIIERMIDIGGESRTVTAPGRGTLVELRWPSTQPVDDRFGPRADPEAELRRALALAAVPGLVAGVLMTLLSGPLVHPAWLSMLSALLAMVVGARSVQILRHRQLGPAEVALLLLAACAGWLVNLALVPHPPVLNLYLLWMAWGSSTLVHLLVLTTQPARAIRVVIGWLLLQICGLAIRYDSWSILWRLSSLYTGGVGEPAVTLMTLLISRHLISQQMRAALVSARLQAATARLEFTASLDHHWSRKVTTEALPLLAAVAEGQLDPHDAEVRERASALEVALRDELVLGHGQATLLAALARARVQGWHLTTTLSAEDPQAALDRAAALVGLLGSPSIPRQRATISAARGQVLAVVLGADEVQTAAWTRSTAELGGRTQPDPDFVRLTLPVTPS